jgi:hypothetical protein
MAYEYQIVTMPLPIDDEVATGHMDELGADGWRLVLVTMTNEARLWFIRDLTGEPPGSGSNDMMANSTLEIVAGDHQIIETPGAVGTLYVHIAGSDGGWMVADSLGSPISEAIIWAATYDSVYAAGGAVVRLDFPLKNGLWLRVPSDGVCSLSWDGVKQMRS